MRKNKEQTWKEIDPVMLKYIDDQLHIDVVNMQAVQITRQKGKLCRKVHPVRSQNILDHVTRRAEDRGMAVNDGKTKVAVVSAATSYTPKAYLNTRDGTTIESNNSIRVLGCIFDANTGTGTQVDNVVRKLRAGTWCLAALRKHGFTTEEMVRIYTTHIRPVAEYASVAWHSTITKEQTENFERQQTHALRGIFGGDISAKKPRDLAGVTTLWERRESTCLKFALKN